MKKSLLTLKITLFQFLLLFSFAAFGQCNIDALFVEITACEGEAFDVSIDFEYEDTSDQFTVTGNGNNYGTFNYSDLPIMLTSLDANCLTEYEFVITDVNNNDCSDFVEWGIVCCDEQCVLWDLELTPSECDGGDFQLTIDFNYQGNTSPTFDWEIVGVSSGTAFFADLPITVTVFDAQDELLGFVVTESNNPNCFIETSFENPCVDPACFIGVVFVEVTDCVEDEFGVMIDFQYSNTSDQFTVAGNGMNYGTFSYGDLPITIDGLVGNCTTEYEFVITDVNDNDCSNFNELGTVCCGGAECDLFDLVIEVSECDGTEFSVTFDFEYTGTTVDFFDWEVPGVSSGFAAFGDLPLTIGIDNTTDNVLSLIINENDNPNCAIDGLFDNPCFNANECFIGELDIEVSECTNNQFFVEINFEYDNTSDEFFVNTNGNNYGPYQYANLPITIQGLESNCNSPYEFLVYDSQQNGTCESDANIGVVCCDEPCEITSIDFGPNPECVDGIIVTEWFIFAQNTSEVGFDIYINNEFYIFVEYNGDGPYDFDIEDPGTEYFTIKACDNDNADCCYTWEVMNPCFEGDECNLFDLVIETSECDGGFFEVTFDFEYTGTTNNFFDWEIPGYSSGFAEFADLPLTVLVQNTNSNGFDLYINENDNPSCAIEGSFENPCFGEECFIGEINVDVSECDGNQFFVVIDFEYDNTSDDFTVFGNGNNYGTFAYADLPITIDGLEGNCNLEYEFIVGDVNNNDCISETGIGIICCNNDCEMTALDFGANPECVDGLIVTEWFISGENISEVGFDIFINDVFEIFVSYNETNWYDFDIEDPGTEYFTIKACDNDNANCCIEWEVMNPCFDGEECNLFDLVIETSECDGGLFEVTFDFEYTGTTNNFFDWEIPGYSSGFAEFSDLPLTILVQNTNANSYDLIINENDNPNCAVDGSFENPCFEEDCFIGELDVDVSECDGNFFFVVINFEYDNTSDQFIVNGNGNSYGTFTYADLPITIDGLESDCDLIYEFVVHDMNNNDCASDIDIGEVCCDIVECDLFDLVIETSDCDGGFFQVTFDFEYVGNTNNFFDWEIPGYDSGFAEFSDLPMSITIQNTNVNGFDLIINENDNPDCAIDGSFENPCFDPEECFIGELDIDVSECDGNIFHVVINFDYANTSDQFFVNANGINYGPFSYSDLPVTIEELEGGCNSTYEFQVYDSEQNGTCTSELNIGEVCCESDDCFIGELNVEVSDCDGNFFFVVINFEYANTSDQFTVNGNGNSYGTFSYSDLPITIDGLESNCDLDYEFVVHDSEFGDCASDIGIGEVCCESDDCFIGELNVEVSECDGNFFFVVINFEYANTSDQFTVNGNGNSYGTFSYADLPITIDGLESDCDLEYEFVVHDVQFNDCASDIGIGEVCCDETLCEIISIESSDNPVCAEGFIIAEWFILGENLSEVGFDIFINNDFYLFVEYNETNWYDFDIENPGTEYITIKACDNDNNDCCYTFEIMNPCFEGAECDLFDLNFDVSECDENFFILQVDFEYSGNTNESFVWEIPGIGSGTELFSNLPLSIEIENSTETQFTFFANEFENPDCSIVGTFGNPCFDSEECVIDAVSAEVILCEDDLFDVEIDFEYDNVGASFTIVGNGVDYGTFEYGDLPVILTGLSADCTLEYEFVVSDNENEQCSDFVEIGTICCEDFNQINGVQSKTVIDNDIFNITFDITNTTLKGCSIDVYIDGELYETLPENESSFEVGPFECGQDEIIEIKLINSCSDAELTLMFDLANIDCTTDVDITLDSIDLKWNMIQKTLTLEGEVPVSVNVQLINAQGALILKENGVEIGWNRDLSHYPSGLYFVRIVDNNTSSNQGLIKKILIY